MINLATVRELSGYNDWARDRLLARAAELGDAALDRPFEMGEGSLRATLRHLWFAERIWLCRWRGVSFADHAADSNDPALSVPRLNELWTATGAERDEYLRGRSDADLARALTYTNLHGETQTYPLGDMVLHVCNHGMHHRAQALNMLRHVGAPPFEPGLDYIFMKRDRPHDPPPAVTVASMQAYMAYNDWAQGLVLDLAADLSDAQLDRPFEMGEGTLRATLLHIRFAEQWWLEIWTLGPDHPFPEQPPNRPLVEIRRLADETAAARRAYLATLRDGNLLRSVQVRPRPGIERHFPLGVTMLQICNHGTHHRAQALNMLRHLGASIPASDYLISLKRR